MIESKRILFESNAEQLTLQKGEQQQELGHSSLNTEVDPEGFG
jgi:hypothetical protein